MASVDRLSTEEIMRLSIERFNRISYQQRIDLSTMQEFFDPAQFVLSDEEIKDAELALVLIASAHKVSNKHFDDARRLLNLCDFLSSRKGNSVQRVVHYFAKALQERIAREMGINSSKESETKEKRLLRISKLIDGVNPALISCSLQLPCIQIAHFAGIQTGIDSLASAKKVHFVDLAIRSGAHCPVLMQALANRQECPVELLKITAVTIPEMKQKIEEIGKCLTRFAETINLPFSFSVVIVKHIKELSEEMFEICYDEVIAIFSRSVLRNIKALPNCLQSLLRVLRNLNPCVLVIIELEANHSSPIFIDRFHESLLFYSSFYGCIEACVKEGHQNRLPLEACLGEEIRDIVAAKDEERIFEHMKIHEWRAYFSGFGMVETEVSMTSFDQAELLLKNFTSGKLCTVVRNGKCLVIGWKGTPLLSVSAWKFQQQHSESSCSKKSKG